ncbi:site-specific DNA-methyltransferase [Prevotella copri]|uniref:site-specific DNA-methyltransferase (adenine-specific) n=1 Tax=Segatella copri TaxID=165179 RepID=A0A6A7WC86_9BACT|nr:site-specific DNA-methyltransferase [Segatella copri]MQP11958.1 site-specific DNA-methyltransferase [Segatella copri]
MDRPNRMKLQSADGVQLNLDALYQIAPSCFTEVADPDSGGGVKRVVNFDVLRQLLGDNAVEDAPEAYEFNWVGKQAARAEVLKPIKKTLRPVKEDSVDWDNTQNLYIEGDNLEVLKLLQKSYLGKVKMIYIDPPYNTGNDFVYHDDFAMSADEYAEASGAVDELGNKYIKNMDSNGRFHSDWCSMIYSRLMVARTLLTEDGVIFISIDDNEVENLRKICDEVLGENNFVTNIVWQSTAGSNTGTDIVTVTENILVYTKNRNVFKFNGKLSDENSYTLSDEYENIRGKYSLDKMDRRRVGSHYSEALNYPITMPDGSLRYPGGYSEKSAEGWNYLWSKTKVDWGLKNGFIVFKQNNGVWNVYNKRYSKVDNEGNVIERSTPYRNLITSDICNTAQGTAEIRNLFGNRFFDFPKPTKIINILLNTVVRKDKDSIILDFFSGSATTAHAVMQLNAEDGGNRKFIMVQLPEETPEDSEARKAGYNTIPDIAKERIRRAGKKIKEESPLTTADLDTGFRVFRLDEGNYEDVNRTPKEFKQDQLDLFLNNIKADRNDLDLLFGCMLDWGVQLSLPMTQEVVDGKTIYTVNDGDLVACFAENVSEDVVKAMAEKMPLRVIFRDSCFAQDADKINIYETFKQKLDWSDQEVVKNIRVI